jgi:ribosomal protein S18 acetylase RimI-like enzyme
MQVIVVTDKGRLRAHFSQDAPLHVYELGDLDDFFWPHTRWYALADGDLLRAVSLVYAATELPVVLALGGAPVADLLVAIRDRLPSPIYAHLSPGLYTALADRYRSEPHGDFVKMALEDRAPIPNAHTTRLGPSDRAELASFYEESYPGNWFDPRMLETGHYVGVREGNRLVAAGGVHVCSPTERVAALGNIAVATDRRGHGLGRRVTAAVCRSLRDAGIVHVGLNVRADNRAAIACYERLGFVLVGRYEEHLLTARS